MSQENVEIVRAGWNAWTTGGVEASLEFISPEVVTYPFPAWIGNSEFRGHDGVREMNAWWTDNFENFSMEIRGLREADDEVVALFAQSGMIKGSKLPIDQRIGALFSDFCDGKFGTIRWFPSWREALEAAGLEE